MTEKYFKGSINGKEFTSEEEFLKSVEEFAKEHKSLKSEDEKIEDKKLIEEKTAESKELGNQINERMNQIKRLQEECSELIKKKRAIDSELWEPFYKPNIFLNGTSYFDNMIDELLRSFRRINF